MKKNQQKVLFCSGEVTVVDINSKKVGIYETTNLEFDAELKLRNYYLTSGSVQLIFDILSSSYDYENIPEKELPKTCRVYSKELLDVLLNCNKGYIKGRFKWIKRGWYERPAIKLLNVY